MVSNLLTKGTYLRWTPTEQLEPMYFFSCFESLIHLSFLPHELGEDFAFNLQLCCFRAIPPFYGMFLLL